ncbi:hypothetical protein DSL92_05835 [Billgrantia gudaonensis]|uniref:Uncharacterized protein n=1 Tax=Billgrantia gudaonensis TaxID=376427 RepID=A0A432JIU8_9GAMM|nr:hypothetical protein DSL92_05835 [Halomonas gudaonensis]
MVADLAVPVEALALDASCGETAVRPPEGKALTVYQRLLRRGMTIGWWPRRGSTWCCSTGHGRPTAVPVASVRDAVTRRGGLSKSIRSLR